MFYTVDATSEISTIYFIVFMLFGFIFLINLAVSVIVNNYIILADKETRIEELTVEQKEWFKLIKYFLKFYP